MSDKMEMGAMSMSTIFSTGTHVTLFFKEWSTTTVSSYIATIICLFLLAVLNRFLGAVKFQTERAWLEQARKTNMLPPLRIVRNSRLLFKAKLSPLPTSIARDDDLECDPLTSPTDGELGDEWCTPKEHNSQRQCAPFRRILGDWQPSARWSVKKDGLRAVMEFIRAFIGYILMLAVMTLNLGIFFAVLGGILVGELIFGRYIQGYGGWQEGACHDG
ncbi:hypothetical protein VE04_02957 [Pseudogymnoascus sp. 24MN13]|nr:hypothetical protein VE04_02957 [Pseudogymnoascus sp. 24MN13]